MQRHPPLSAGAQEALAYLRHPDRSSGGAWVSLEQLMAGGFYRGHIDALHRRGLAEITSMHGQPHFRAL